MIKPNEAIEMARQFHEEAYREARIKWVPYWMDKLNNAIISAASHGHGECRLELNWAERLGINSIPDQLVQEYTERILDEELACNTGYRVIKLPNNMSTPFYRIVWYSEQYDAYEEARSHGIQEKEDYPLPSLS